jgi:hypothetical protein
VAKQARIFSNFVAIRNGVSYGFNIAFTHGLVYVGCMLGPIITWNLFISVLSILHAAAAVIAVLDFGICQESAQTLSYFFIGMAAKVEGRSESCHRNRENACQWNGLTAD